MRLLKIFVLAPAALFAMATMAQAPGFQNVGTVRQIMLSITKPTSDVVFKYQFEPPKTDEEWTALQNNALTLAESGNLLLLPGRVKDSGEWTKTAKELVASGAEAFKAANAKDAKTLEMVGDTIDGTCEACHAKYLSKPAK